MPRIDCKINLILTWRENCVITDSKGAETFVITDTKLYVLVVTLSVNDNAKLLQQLKSGFKRTINWNNYQSKVTIERQSQYLDYLIDPSFQGGYRPFISSIENNVDQTGHMIFFPKIEIKDYYIIIDGQTFFDQIVKYDLRTEGNIKKLKLVN